MIMAERAFIPFVRMIEASPKNESTSGRPIRSTMRPPQSPPGPAMHAHFTTLPRPSRSRSRSPSTSPPPSFTHTSPLTFRKWPKRAPVEDGVTDPILPRPSTSGFSTPEQAGPSSLDRRNRGLGFGPLEIPTLSSRNLGLNRRERALWRWVNVEDMDAFLMEVRKQTADA